MSPQRVTALVVGGVGLAGIAAGSVFGFRFNGSSQTAPFTFTNTEALAGPTTGCYTTNFGWTISGAGL
jgi:hypothetical protein